MHAIHRRSGQPRIALDPRHFVLANQEIQPFGVLHDDSAFARLHGAPVQGRRPHAPLTETDAKLGRVQHVVPDFGVEKQRLGGNAAHVQARPAQFVGLLDERNFQPILRAAKCRRIPARTAAHNCYVKNRVCHLPSLIPGAARRPRVASHFSLNLCLNTGPLPASKLVVLFPQASACPGLPMPQKPHRRAALFTAFLLAIHPALAVQDMAPPGRAPTAGIPIPGIPGSPFSATLVLESERIWPDGSSEILRTINLIARDAQGRTHYETRRLMPQYFHGSPETISVHIFDPLTGILTVYDPIRHIARRQFAPKMATAVPPAKRSVRIQARQGNPAHRNHAGL